MDVSLLKIEHIKVESTDYDPFTNGIDDNTLRPDTNHLHCFIKNENCDERNIVKQQPTELNESDTSGEFITGLENTKTELLHEEVDIKDNTLLLTSNEIDLKFVKPFICDICNKKFTQKSNLRTHIKKHTTANLSQCTICGKNFASHIHLQRHIVSHTNEKPSECKISDSGGDSGVNSVEQILKLNFLSLSLSLKIKIKRLGRPIPVLDLSQTCTKKKEGRTFTRYFTNDIYVRNKWICGCNIRNSLFCFPCMLFFTPNTDKNWSRIGITDLNHLHEKIKKHDVSKAHIQASTEFALLGKANIATQLSSTYRQNIAVHNDLVKKNRHLLRRIISCVKFCGVFGLPPQGDAGILQGLIDYSAELDTVLKENLATSVLKNSVEIIQNDILDCMLTVCQDEISKEVDATDYLSIQCDETSGMSSHCQMVLILRYVIGHAIYERFWCFLRITDESSDGLVRSIQKEIDPLIKNLDKLIAQTYDGARVMTGSVGSVQAKMRKKYPFAYFVHCYAHPLNLLMQRATAQSPQVRIFFADLSGVAAFFSNSSQRSPVVDKIIKVRLPHVASTQWNFNGPLINTVYENKEHLLLCLQEIVQKAEETITIKEANNLRRTLEDSIFTTWLEVFHKICCHVDMIYNEYQFRPIEHTELQKEILNFEDSVSNISYVFKDIEQECQTESVSKRKRSVEIDQGEELCTTEICDLILTQMKDRFSNRDHLEANYLLINSSFQSFNSSFPFPLFFKVTKMYPMLLKERLKTELEVIYSRRDFSQLLGATSTLEFILKNDLESTFSEVVKLLKIVLTTPMSTSEPERCFSTLERVKNFLTNFKFNDSLNPLAMLSINKDFVCEIPNFEEKVLEKFVMLESRRSDFSFKD